MFVWSEATCPVLCTSVKKASITFYAILNFWCSEHTFCNSSVIDHRIYWSFYMEFCRTHAGFLICESQVQILLFFLLLDWSQNVFDFFNFIIRASVCSQNDSSVLCTQTIRAVVPPTPPLSKMVASSPMLTPELCRLVLCCFPCGFLEWSAETDTGESVLTHKLKHTPLTVLGCTSRDLIESQVGRRAQC